MKKLLNQTPLETFGKKTLETKNFLPFIKHNIRLFDSKALSGKNRFLAGQKGFASLFLVLLILTIVFGIVISITFLVSNQYKISRNIISSSQAYYAAESGIEDVLLRISRSMQWNTSYSFLTENSTIQVVVSDDFAGSRTITGIGNTLDRFRKVQIVYELSSLTPGLFYGAQVGDGGLIIENNASVIGNVFSNGNVELKGPQSKVTETVLIANEGNKLFGSGEVEKEAYVDICEGITVTETLHANTVSGCSFASHTTSGLPVDPVPLPIADSQIEEFKNIAAEKGTIGNYTRDSGVHHLGPIKVEGNLIIRNTAQLIITGTIWATGEIRISNSAQVRLDPSYGSESGLIIGSGLIRLENSSVSSGSGAPGSYLMYVSTSSANPAIVVRNFAEIDILYSNTGWVVIENNSKMRSVNAHGIHVDNAAVLTYEIGLADARFASGPGAGWEVVSWKEIE